MVVGVLVLDINDNDPVILNLPYNTSVSEGAPIYTSVGRVQARDADSGRNALLTYNITAGNPGGAFYINDTVRGPKPPVTFGFGPHQKHPGLTAAVFKQNPAEPLGLPEQT